MSTELKPCPFCGGLAEIFKDSRLVDNHSKYDLYVVKCTSCGAKSSQAPLHEVTERWNRRAKE